MGHHGMGLRLPSKNLNPQQQQALVDSTPELPIIHTFTGAPKKSNGP